MPPTRGGDLSEPLGVVDTAVAELLGGGDLTKRVLDVLAGRLPKFFYFGEYSVLTGPHRLANTRG